MPILFLFDVRTMAILVAIAFFIQGAAMGAQAFLIRDLRQYRGVGAALMANLCVAVGFLLRLFVEQLPPFFSTILASTLILAGPALYYVAIGQFTGQEYSKSAVIGVITYVLLFLMYFTYVNDSSNMRVLTHSLGVVAILCYVVYQLWRAQKTSLQFSASLMLASFLIYGIFLLGRTLSFALNPPENLSSNTPVVLSATYLMLFIISFFWTIGFILMVSQRLRNDLMELATIDVLTRIPNRRATQSFLEKELSRVQRNQTEFSVLLIDLDNFKTVNDRWGHLVGDHVLATTASLFQCMIRKQDWVGRWGGEEFLLILPGSPYCDAEALAERLRSEIAITEYSNAAACFHITVSIGVTCADRTSTVDQILKMVDDALYEAKSTKNTVKMAG